MRAQTTHTVIIINDEILHNILTTVDKMKLHLLLSLSNHGSSRSLHLMLKTVFTRRGVTGKYSGNIREVT